MPNDVAGSVAIASVVLSDSPHTVTPRIEHHATDDHRRKQPEMFSILVGRPSFKIWASTWDAADTFILNTATRSPRFQTRSRPKDAVMICPTTSAYADPITDRRKSNQRSRAGRPEYTTFKIPENFIGDFVLPCLQHRSKNHQAEKWKAEATNADVFDT